MKFDLFRVNLPRIRTQQLNQSGDNRKVDDDGGGVVVAEDINETLIR